MKQQFNIGQLSKENIFTVPENYFQQLEQNILQKTIYEPKVVHITFYKRYSKWLTSGIAASLLIFSFSYYIFKQDTTINIDKELNSISKKEIVQYLQEEDDISMIDHQLSISNTNIIEINKKEKMHLSDNEYQEIVEIEGLDETL